MGDIHTTAIIGQGARIGRYTSVGPYTVIEDDVEIGEGCLIDSCAKICSGVRMGDRNQVGHGAVLGGAPQKLDFDPRIRSGVAIGHGNIFREQTTVHRSMVEGQNTIIGDANFVMATGHVAHDCVLENGIVICNGVLLAGHVTVGERSFISGNVVVHQFCNIGDYVMIGGGSRITQDCLHYSLVVGADAGRVVGPNSIGLRRAGFSLEDQEAIKAAFRTIFWRHLSLSKIKERLKRDANRHVQRLAVFLENSTRGICPGRKQGPRSQDPLPTLYICSQDPGPDVSEEALSFEASGCCDHLDHRHGEMGADAFDRNGAP